MAEQEIAAGEIDVVKQLKTCNIRQARKMAGGSEQ